MFLKSKFLTLGLVIIIGWILIELIEIKNQDILADNEIKNTESKIQDLEKNNQDLSRVIDNAQNPEFLEREAKIKLNYKKIDEQVAFIYRSEENMASLSDNLKNRQNMPNYKKWRYWLLGD